MVAAPIFCLGLAIAGLYCVWLVRPVSATRSILKTLPLTLFALAAFLADAPFALVGGLFLSAMGDLALSRDGERAFLSGLASFAAAHGFYILLFLSLADAAAFASFSNHPLPSVLILLVAASSVAWLIPYTGAMRWPVCIYVGLITGMMITALALPQEYLLIKLGAASFVASDIVLSLRLFRLSENSPLAAWFGFSLWVLYVAGQR